MSDLTAKQAREAKSALTNLLDRANSCFESAEDNPYQQRDDGMWIAPTHWESVALFRLLSFLELTALDGGR